MDDFPNKKDQSHFYKQTEGALSVLTKVRHYYRWWLVVIINIINFPLHLDVDIINIEKINANKVVVMVFWNVYSQRFLQRHWHFFWIFPLTDAADTFFIKLDWIKDQTSKNPKTHCQGLPRTVSSPPPNIMGHLNIIIFFLREMLFTLKDKFFFQGVNFL